MPHQIVRFVDEFRSNGALCPKNFMSDPNCPNRGNLDHLKGIQENNTFKSKHIDAVGQNVFFWLFISSPIHIWEGSATFLGKIPDFEPNCPIVPYPIFAVMPEILKKLTKSWSLWLPSKAISFVQLPSLEREKI